MAMITVSGYQEANETLRLSDLRQALYDEGAILMEKVLVNLHGQEHRTRRQQVEPEILQVDLAGESTKFGAREDELRAIFAAAEAATSISLRGLMLIPPAVADAEDARPWFRRLRETRDRLVASGVNRDRLTDLSMGMSHDYEIAVEEGATLVRVGTAIFGRRSYPTPL